jgi:uncharacterized membrane protein
MFGRSLIAAACLAATAASAAATKWTIVDILPTWGGIAQSVNNRGEVTGWKYSSNPIPGHVAFVWRNGELQELGIPAGEFASSGFGISNNGIIAGDTNQRPAIWRDGAWTVIPLYGTLNDVNERGTAVGGMRFPGKFDSSAAMYRDGVVTDLGTIPGGNGYSFAWAVNNSGVIVGSASLPSPPFSGIWTFRGFVYENGAMRDIGTLGGNSSYLYDVNNSGTAVGASELPGGRLVATIYQNGVLRPLANIPGNSAARAINERGDVIGSSDAGGWLYSDGQVTMLAQIPEVRAAGYTQLSPLAINDRGWITGTGSKNGGQSFVLMPK